MKNKNNRLRIDFYAVLGIEILAAIFTTGFKLKFLDSTLLYFALPAVYLVTRKPRPLKRIFLASLFFGILLLFEMDYFAELNNAWVVEGLYFPYKIFGVVPPELIIWGFFWVFYILVFYEHFFEGEHKDKVSPNYIYGLIPASIILVAILFGYLCNTNYFQFGYSYLILGGLTLLPLMFSKVRKIAETPKMLVRFVKCTAFFVCINLIYEYTALRFGQWHYPGQHVGLIPFAGLMLPIEEVLFWIIASTAILLTYYEFFFDDGK